MKIQSLVAVITASLGLGLAGPLSVQAQPEHLKSNAPDLDKVAGVYKHRFANGTISGDKFTSEDVFELVKLTPKTAYFRIHAEFFNGHECNLWGVADLEADALTYHGPPDVEDKPCVLKFTANEVGIITNDVGGYCQNESCGSRGGYGYGNSVEYLFQARRRIRYMPVILKSPEYLSAIKEHRAHPVGTPSPGSPDLE